MGGIESVIEFAFNATLHSSLQVAQAIGGSESTWITDRQQLYHAAELKSLANAEHAPWFLPQTVNRPRHAELHYMASAGEGPASVSEHRFGRLGLIESTDGFRARIP
jgi:hypothetical protein